MDPNFPPWNIISNQLSHPSLNLHILLFFSATNGLAFLWAPTELGTSLFALMVPWVSTTEWGLWSQTGQCPTIPLLTMWLGVQSFRIILSLQDYPRVPQSGHQVSLAPTTHSWPWVCITCADIFSCIVPLDSESTTLLCSAPSCLFGMISVDASSSTLHFLLASK